MKKVLIVHFSVTGKTESMAEFIAEGVRFNGIEAVVKKISDIHNVADLKGFDGYIFGSPTFSQDVPKPVKNFLDLAQQADLKGKLVGSFGSYKHDTGYRHDSSAPAAMIDIITEQHKMVPFDLGPFALKEDLIDTREGMKACQDYGKVFGEKLAD
jgi:flavodoxin